VRLRPEKPKIEADQKAKIKGKVLGAKGPPFRGAHDPAPHVSAPPAAAALKRAARY